MFLPGVSSRSTEKEPYLSRFTSTPSSRSGCCGSEEPVKVVVGSVVVTDVFLWEVTVSSFLGALVVAVGLWVVVIVVVVVVVTDVVVDASVVVVVAEVAVVVCAVEAEVVETAVGCVGCGLGG